MAKDTYLQRFSLIIKRLEKGPATFEQISRYLEDAGAIADRDYSISIRTLQRDIQEIYRDFDIEIVNEKKGDKRYFIQGRPETKEHSHRLLEAYEMVSLVKASQENASVIFFENRKPVGLHHFDGLLYAINNKKTVHFSYHKYWDDSRSVRTVHPLALKEARGRWYVLAIDTRDVKLKSFGLDRIDGMEISKTSFKDKYDYNFATVFEHSFGIINDVNSKPQKVRLSFSFEEGQYVKTYPLHTSQQVTEINGRVEIELFMSITHDFIMELLSYGGELVVLSPKNLVTTIINSLATALGNYE